MQGWLIFVIILVIVVVCVLGWLFYFMVSRKHRKTIMLSDLQQTQEHLQQIATPTKKLNLPVYVINLERSTGRRQLMQEQATFLNVVFHFVTAIDYMNLQQQDKDVFQVDDTSITVHGKITSRELACTLSHLKAIKEAYNAKHEYAVISEDDVSWVLAPHWPTDLVTLSQQMQHQGANIMSLFNHGHPPFQHHPLVRHQPQNIWGAQAYIISRQGMHNILEACFQTPTQIHIPDQVDPVADMLVYELGGPSTLLMSFSAIFPFNSDETSTIHPKHDHMHLSAALDAAYNSIHRLVIPKYVTLVLTLCPRKEYDWSNIVTALSSIQTNVSAHIPIVLSFDGNEPNPDLTHPKCLHPANDTTYTNYKQQVINKTQSMFNQVTVTSLKKRGCLTSNLENALDHVHTPFVLIMQGDMEIYEPYPLFKLMHIMTNNKHINGIQDDFHGKLTHKHFFNKVCPGHYRKKEMIAGIPMIKMSTFSDQFSLFKTQWYKDNILEAYRGKLSFPEEVCPCWDGEVGLYLLEKRYTKHLDGRRGRSESHEKQTGEYEH